MRALPAAVVCGALVLGACAGGGLDTDEQAPRAVAAGVHVVKAGETLYGIAERYRIDYRDLARWNQLGDGALIFPGQRLRLSPPGAATTQGGRGPAPGDLDLTPPPARWQWPAAGPVEVGYRQSQRTESGILIGGQVGASVRAAADGEVVYAGSGLAGYGQLLIVRHNAAWLSAYGHCQELLVTEGQQVRAGAQIARMGEGPGRRPAVHFEIRRNGEPVDPLRYLPPRP